MTPGWLERSLNVALTTAVIVLAAVVVYREFVPRKATATAEQFAPVFHDNWRGLVDSSQALGDTSGRVQLIEFGDLECPACRQLHLQTLPAIRAEFGSEVSVRFRHFPLSNHRFARPAAIAAECAGRQGRFAAFLETTFAKQDSLGIASWASLAKSAGVTDPQLFERCVTGAAPNKRIDTDDAVARRLGLRGTPTVIINGWQVPAPTAKELARVASELLAGNSPYSLASKR